MSDHRGHRLLLDEQPLIVLPRLAQAIGLNEAIFLQQVHYWLMRSTHEVDGQFWIYNTMDQWHEQFPFWSVRTIRNISKGLEERGLILTGNFNESRLNQTRWYTIDYDVLGGLTAPSTPVVKSDKSIRQDLPHGANPSQNGQIDGIRQDLPDRSGKIRHIDPAKSATSIRQSLPSVNRDYLTETNSETTTAAGSRVNGASVAPPDEPRGGGGGGDEGPPGGVPPDVRSALIGRLTSEAKLRPKQAAAVVASGLVSKDADVDRCVAFVQSSDAEKPPAVLWSEWLSQGQLPPAPEGQPPGRPTDAMSEAEILAFYDRMNRERYQQPVPAGRGVP